MYGPTTGPPMSGWTFQVPPSWPAPPEGWTPPPGWTPRPEWPAPPAGWTFWVSPGAPVLPSQQSRVETASGVRPPAPSAPPLGQPRYAPPAPPLGQPRYAPPAPSAPPLGPWGFAPPRGPVPAGAVRTSHAAPVPHGERVGRLVFVYIGLVVGWFVLGLVLGRMFRVHVNPAEYSTEEAYRAAWDRAVVNANLSIRGIAVAVNAVLFVVLAHRAGFAGRSCLLVLVPVMGLVVAIRVLWRWTDIEHWERTVGYPGKSYFRWDRPNMTLRQD